MMNEIKIKKAIEVLAEVKNLPEPNFLWKGIPEGSKGLLTGVGKTGKTTFAENLAISLCVGRKEFFGFEMDGKPRKVLFINLEEKQTVWGKRQLKQIKQLSQEELELFSTNYLTIPDEFIDFVNSEKDWLSIRNYIIAADPDIVILDSLSHLCVGEIERSVVAQKFVQDFRKHIASINKTTIVIHHNTKGNNKPVEMENIAGSRFITQEFEYAYGFANVPGADDESYISMVYNKHVPRENSTGYTYSFTSNGWVEQRSVVNKYKLYQGTTADYRFVTDNKEKIYNYFITNSTESTTSTTSMESTTKQNNETITITASDLSKYFCSTGIMAKDTLFRNIKVLIEEKKIAKDGAGKYILLNDSKNSTSI